MRLADLVAVSAAVGSTRSRREKIARLADALRAAGPGEIGVAVCYLAGILPQGKIGLGWAAVRDARGEPAEESTLSLLDVDRCLSEIEGAGGAGAGGARKRLFGELLARATREEQEFLAALVLGELRQGASEGLMEEAIAQAAAVPVAAVRRALMLSGDLARTAASALADGEAGLAAHALELFRPVLPMLAQPAEDLADALARLGEASFEFKLDGARVQLHKQGELVRVYSRGLNEITVAAPELVEAARQLPVREAILDGEAIAMGPEGKPRAFQTTMRRFGRRLDVDELRRTLPLSAFWFDCLLLDGTTLIHRSAAERIQALASVLPEAQRVTRIVTADHEVVDAFWRSALAHGHEGLMAKALGAAYEAGGRGGSWLKLKPAHTLDLVVLGAEWGSGRRRGWLSNLHLGARDPAGGGFVMLGKTFKGLTDETLTWQTARLLELEIGRDEHTVYVRPEQVVEIAFNDVQASKHYPGGVALRFARVKRYRPDKGADEADTIDAVRAILARTMG